MYGPTMLFLALILGCGDKSGAKALAEAKGSWFPLVDRNPQRFVDIYSAREEDFQSAVQRVYRIRELGNCALAHRIEQSSVMFGDQVLEDLAANFVALGGHRLCMIRRVIMTPRAQRQERRNPVASCSQASPSLYLN